MVSGSRVAPEREESPGTRKSANPQLLLATDGTTAVAARGLDKNKVNASAARRVSAVVIVNSTVRLVPLAASHHNPLLRLHAALMSSAAVAAVAASPPVIHGCASASATVHRVDGSSCSKHWIRSRNAASNVLPCAATDPEGDACAAASCTPQKLSQSPALIHARSLHAHEDSGR